MNNRIRQSMLRIVTMILLLTFIISSCGSPAVETTVPAPAVLATTAATSVATIAPTPTPPPATPAPTPSPAPFAGFPSLLSGAVSVISSLKTANYSGLAAAVDPATGLRFSAYTYVDVATDLVFTPTQIAGFPTDATLYNWGAYDGSGDPIQLTAANYFLEFVYSSDFESADLIGINNVIGVGNTLNNFTTAYPGASFVEFHFTGFDPQYGGMDWQSLTLVFHQVGGNWYLIGIIHGQWTI